MQCLLPTILALIHLTLSTLWLRPGSGVSPAFSEGKETKGVGNGGGEMLLLLLQPRKCASFISGVALLKLTECAMNTPAHTPLNFYTHCFHERETPSYLYSEFIAAHTNPRLGYSVDVIVSPRSPSAALHPLALRRLLSSAG